jgi:small subunit ribosomal protein S24e
MSEGAIIIRAKKFLLNRLLARRQMILEVIHPGQPNVANDVLKGHLAKKYKTDAKNIIVYGFKTAFGGGRSHGFCLIYDNFDSLQKYEPKYTLRRLKVIEDRMGNRKQRKEIKTKRKRVRGTAKSKIQTGKKK